MTRVRSRAPRPPKVEPHWLSQGDMARSLRISTQAFARWGVKPVARVGRTAYYAVSDVIANRIARQARETVAGERERPPAGEIELRRAESEARIGLLREQCVGQALKNAEQRRVLAPLVLLAWVFGRVTVQVAEILEGLPKTLRKRLPRLTARDLGTIKREIVRAQRVATEAVIDLEEFEGKDGPATRAS